MLKDSEAREKRDFCPTVILTLSLGKNKAGQSRQLPIMDFIHIDSSGTISQAVGAAGESCCCYQQYENRFWVSSHTSETRACPGAAESI